MVKRPLPLFAMFSVLAAGCVIPPGGDGTEPPCTSDVVGATFEVPSAEVGGDTLGFSDCAARCEDEVMQAYPDHTVTLCEYQSTDGAGDQTYYCEWEAVVACE